MFVNNAFKHGRETMFINDGLLWSVKKYSQRKFK